MIIGVLALQGAFIEHAKILNTLGIQSMEIRNQADLVKPFDGLILPGGESTVMAKLLNELGMMGVMRRQIENGLPVFGTCAGMILLAGRIHRSEERHLATMDIAVERNAYGRQLGSFQTVSQFGAEPDVPMTFIRAPYIRETGKKVQILAQVDGRIVAARQGSQLAVAFHPELGGNTTVHRYFAGIVSRSGRP